MLYKRDRASVYYLCLNYRQWTNVFPRFQFSLYISYKIAIFQIITLKAIDVQLYCKYTKAKHKILLISLKT